MTGRKSGRAQKSSTPPRASRLPAMLVKEPRPVDWPPSQLSSMNFTTDDWSVTLWLAGFFGGYGELTTGGSRGPYPQRSGVSPIRTGAVVHTAASSVVFEPLTRGEFWW